MNKQKGNNVMQLIFRLVTQNSLVVMVLLLLMIGVVLSSLLPPQILKIIIDTYMGQEKKNTLLFLAFIYFLSLLLSAVLEFFKEVLLTKTGQKITHQIRFSMMQKVKRLPASYFTKNAPGTIVSGIMNDVDTIQNLFSNGIVSMIIDACKIIGILVSICFFSKYLSLMLVLAIPFLYLFIRWVQKRTLASQIQNRKCVAAVNNHIPETISNMEMIKSFNKESYMEYKYQNYIRDNYRMMERVNFYDAVFSPVILVVRAAFIAVMVILCSKEISMLHISVGMVAAAIELISNLFSPLESLGMELQSIQQAVAGVRRVNDFLSEEEDGYWKERQEQESEQKSEQKPKQKSKQKSKQEPKQKPNQKSEQASEQKYGQKTFARMKKQNFVIKFQDVSFSYEMEQEILESVTFEIESGETVSFRGRTGAGKSTLFKLILGFISPNQGTVTIGGIPADRIPSSLKRSVFGYVEQQFEFVEGNFYRQIQLSDSAISNERVEEVMKFVGLHEDILNLPEGYDTRADKASLSNGQCQLLSIARALAANPPIMLLDEMTANLDAKTEEKIISILTQIGKNRIVLSISHRLSAALKCDKRMKIDNRTIKADKADNKR